MPLTRTHNLDITNEDIKRTVLYSIDRDDETKIEIGIADTGAIYTMLSDLSAKKGAYVLREAFSNAYDATVAAGDMSRPIEITLPEPKHGEKTLTEKIYGAMDGIDFVTITDHGIGMSYDTVAEYFLQYGGSNKRDQIDAIGSKGLGSKAPLAVADTFTITTTKDGVTTTAVIERKPGAAGTARCHTEVTGKDSGTTLSIPVSDYEVLNQMNEFLTDLVSTNTDATIIVNGELKEPSLPTRIGEVKNNYVYIGEYDISTSGEPCNVRLWEPLEHKTQYTTPQYYASGFPNMHENRMYISLLLGGVRYDAPTNTGTRPSRPYLAAIEPGWLNFTPSRDEIKDDQAAHDFMRALYDTWSNMDYSSLILEHFKINGPTAITQFAATSEPIEDIITKHTQYYYGNKSFDIQFDEDALRIARKRSRSNYINTARIPYDDLMDLGDWVLPIFKDTIQQVTVPSDINPAFYVHVTPIHILRLRASDHLHTRFTLQFDDKAVKKSKISSVITSNHMLKANLFAQAISQATKESAVVITGVKLPEQIRIIINKEGIWRAYSERVNNATFSDTIHYILVRDEGNIPKALRDTLSNRKVKTIDYETFVEEAKAESSNRRKVNAEQRKATQQSLKANMADAKEVKDIQSSLPVSTMKIPDHHGLSVQNVLMAISSRTLVYDNNHSIEYKRSPWLPSLSQNKAKPFENMAIIISDAPKHYNTLNEMTDWCTLILLSRMYKTRLVPDCVTHIVITTKKVLKKESDLLVLGGATIIDDKRTIKSAITNTVMSRHNITSPYGYRLEVPWKMMFGDDAETATMFKFTKAWESGNTYNANVTVLAYDLIRPYATGAAKTEIIDVLEPVLSHRTLTPTVRYTPPKIVMWTDQNKNQIDIKRSNIEISDMPDGYDKVENAMRILLKQMKPITEIFTNNISLRMPDDESTQKLSTILGPAMVYNINSELQSD